MAEEQKRRNPYADIGLMIAVTLLIVMILRCLIFGISWEDSFWIVLTIAYCVVSYKFDSQSKIVKNTTTGFLLVSVVAMAAIIIIDRKPQPKMHAFEGTNKVDTIPEDSFIQKEEPKLPELENDTIEVPDTIVVSSDQPDPNQTNEGEEGIEPADQTESTEQ